MLFRLLLLLHYVLSDYDTTTFTLTPGSPNQSLKCTDKIPQTTEITFCTWLTPFNLQLTHVPDWNRGKHVMSYGPLKNANAWYFVVFIDSILVYFGEKVELQGFQFVNNQQV